MHLSSLKHTAFGSVSSATLAGSLAYFWCAQLPGVAFGLFGGGAARLVSLLSGSAVQETATGWALPSTPVPVLVTQACNATDFYIMVAALGGWHVAKLTSHIIPKLIGIMGAITVALPLTIAINALRILVVSHAHHWVIPQFPSVYDSLLHMATGAAVFLPALILFNFSLEAYHARSRSSRIH